jgi:hypothetical protein
MKTKMHGNSSGGAVYFFGMIGSALYFIQHATSFGDGVLGILKAIVWPGVLVYRVLEVLNM